MLDLIEKSVLFREILLVEENQADMEQALEALSHLVGFVQSSMAMSRWIHNPEVPFCWAIKALLRLRGQWAKNLAIQLRWYTVTGTL
jgi:hypothetical protein